MEHAGWLLLHLCCAIYWLGSDLVVYYVSGFIVDRQRSAAERALAARIMLWADMLPRTAVVLTLPTGFTLAWSLGFLSLDGQSIFAIWLFAAAWLALTWAVFLKERTELGHRLARFDFALRIAIILGLAFLIWRSARGLGPMPAAPWLLGKVGLFAFVMALGLVIRVQLKPFGPLFGKVLAGTAQSADEDALRRLIDGIKYVVWVLWAALFVAIYLGLAKPY